MGADHSDLGARFRAWRHRRHVSQKGVASTLGHNSNTYLSRMERGQLPISTRVAQRWAAALGATLDEIRATAPLTDAEESQTARAPRTAPGPSGIQPYLDLLGPSLARVPPERREEATLKARTAIESCWSHDGGATTHPPLKRSRSTGT